MDVTITSPGSSPHTRGAPSVEGRLDARAGIIPAYAGSTKLARRLIVIELDHPRIRGEHNQCIVKDQRFVGSSPHTRGAPSESRTRGALSRIIPAYAGSTDWTRWSLLAGQDHPRIRGEHIPCRGSPTKVRGSSPHTRGAPYRWGMTARSPGIIPAYAGSTARGAVVLAGWMDHPRIRGEHWCLFQLGDPDGGSSPHTRGARPGIPSHSSSTPDHPRIRGEHAEAAHAYNHAVGSSPHTRGALVRWSEVLDRVRDHPRIRGEHGRGDGVLLPARGSSPHTRGAPRMHDADLRQARIIPAYAGSTRLIRRVVSAPRDHPRIRGEHSIAARTVSRSWGSSPHTRGARGQALRRLGPRRIIPAYAGSTPAGPARGSRSPDHPRIRGEHLVTRDQTLVVGGSSPHTRGARPLRQPGIGSRRDHPRIRGEHCSLAIGIIAAKGSSPHTRGAPST